MRNGKFEELLGEAGSGISAEHASRGCAFGDFDNDGDIDVLVMNMGEPPSLLRNDVTGKNHWIKIKLIGTKCNRSAIGTRVVAHYGGKQQVQEVLSQASFYSVNDPRLHFGLGAIDKVDVDVHWLGGKTEHFAGLGAGHLITIKEGVGITSTQAFPLAGS